MFVKFRLHEIITVIHLLGMWNGYSQYIDFLLKIKLAII